MIENTDWTHVNQLVVYDDGSTDGTWEYLQEAVNRVPVPTILEQTKYRSPVALTNKFVRTTDGDWFVKLDNDVMLPPNWLPEMLGVLERNPDIELLGMEAGMGGRPDPEGWDGVYYFEPSSHIGGVGLMKTTKFRKCGKIMAEGRFGFGQYQEKFEFVRGWITPSLKVVLLDRMPLEPWLSLSAEYRKRRWQRRWPTYQENDCWWDWFVDEEETT